MWAFIKTHVRASLGTTFGGILTVGGLANDAWSIVELGLPGQAWAAIGALIIIASMVAVLVKQHKSLPTGISKTDGGSEAVNSTLQTDVPQENVSPAPIFGCSRQAANQPYLSWPHIPVTLNKPDGEITYCTVELVGDQGLPARMRWQSDDPRGSDEVALIGGRTRMVPIAIRCEIGHESEIHPLPISDGIARITGAAYLRDKQINKFMLSAGRHLFRLRIRSRAKQWDSLHRYMLNVPEKDQSNGQFFLEIWHEGKD